MTSDFTVQKLYTIGMPFKNTVVRALYSPLRIILALTAGVLVFFLVLFVDPKAWQKKFEKGEREHGSDFVNEVDHWQELKNEALDIISYLHGLWTKYWSS